MVVHTVSILSFVALLSSPAGACTVHVHRDAKPYVFLAGDLPQVDPAPEDQRPKDFPLSMVLTAHAGGPWIMREDTISWHPRDVDLHGADCPDLSKLPRHPTLLR